MKLWDRIVEFCNKSASPRIATPIPPNRVLPQREQITAVAEECYLRIFIAQMMLAESRSWFRDQQPSIQAKTQLSFGDNKIEIPMIAAADPARFATGNSVLENFRLLDLVPFRGGTLELDVALVALQGDDRLQRGIEALANVATLVAAPIGGALVLAGKVEQSVNTLVADHPIRLAYHDAFTAQGGARPLQSGFIAIVAAAPADLGNDVLVFDHGKLCRWDGVSQNAAPLLGFDYVVLEIAVLANRDDMRAFSDIAQLRKITLDAFGVSDEAGNKALRTAITTLKLHPELINADRHTLIEELKKDCNDVRAGGLGATPEMKRSWEELVEQMPAGRDHTPIREADYIL